MRTRRVSGRRTLGLLIAGAASCVILGPITTTAAASTSPPPTMQICTASLGCVHDNGAVQRGDALTTVSSTDNTPPNQWYDVGKGRVCDDAASCHLTLKNRSWDKTYRNRPIIRLPLASQVSFAVGSDGKRMAVLHRTAATLFILAGSVLIDIRLTNETGKLMVLTAPPELGGQISFTRLKAYGHRANQEWVFYVHIT